MNTAVISCQTIKRELELALKATGTAFPVSYIDSGLHNFPDQLRAEIQDQIDKNTEAEAILLAFGFCGNGILGIRSTRARLIIPRVDDCITLMLGSYEDRKRISKAGGTYFITQGWLDYEQNILTEYYKSVEKYGPEKAVKIVKMMLYHYERLVVIDTQAYDFEEVMSAAQTFSDCVGIKVERMAGSMRLLKKLLTGPWDDEFIVLQPGHELTFQDMKLGDMKSCGLNQILPNF